MTSHGLSETDRRNTYIIAVQINFHIFGRINIHSVSALGTQCISAETFQIRLFLHRLRRLIVIHGITADSASVFLFPLFLQFKGDSSIFRPYLNVFGQRIISFRLQMYLMNPIRQLYRPADIHNITIYRNLCSLRRDTEQNPACPALRNF